MYGILLSGLGWCPQPRREMNLNNPNISLTVFCEKNKIIYKPNNISGNKAEIVEIENHGYAAIKPLQDKFIKLNKSLKSSSYV